LFLRRRQGLPPQRSRRLRRQGHPCRRVRRVARPRPSSSPAPRGRPLPGSATTPRMSRRMRRTTP
jgi:hypothetical protein